MSRTQLGDLVATEASRVGRCAPEDVRVTLGSGVRVVRGAGSRRTSALTLGLASVAEASAADLRAEVAAALLRDADALHRALVRTREAVAHLAHGTSPLHRAWAVVMAGPAWLLDRALTEREELQVDAIGRTHGRDGWRRLLTAPERAHAFDVYWTEHVSPCLAAGYHPPIGEGWRRHQAGGRRTASLLVVDEDELERRLLCASSAHEARDLVPLRWERAAEAVLVPTLDRELHGASLPAATVGELGAAAAGASDAQRDQLGAAFLLALHRAGWQISWAPGEAVAATLGDTYLLPFAVPFALADHEERRRWERLVAELDLADLALGHRTTSAPADATLLAHQASLPGPYPTEETVLWLDSPLGLRRRVTIILGAGLAAGVPLVAVLAWEAVTLDASAFVRAFVGVMAAGLGALLVRWTASRTRAAWSSGMLTLGPERVVLDHPGLLREPWEIDAARLAAVVVDDGTEARGAAPSTARFPFGESPWDGPGSPGLTQGGWLWHNHSDVFAPVLAAHGEAPNVVLLFDPATSGPQVRRVDLRGPLPGEAVGALLLAVRSPVDAEPRLRERGLLRPLTSADVRRLVAIFRGADLRAQDPEMPSELPDHGPGA